MAIIKCAFLCGSGGPLLLPLPLPFPTFRALHAVDFGRNARAATYLTPKPYTQHNQPCSKSWKHRSMLFDTLKMRSTKLSRQKRLAFAGVSGASWMVLFVGVVEKQCAISSGNSSEWRHKDLIYFRLLYLIVTDFQTGKIQKKQSIQISLLLETVANERLERCHANRCYHTQHHNHSQHTYWPGMAKL